MSTVYGTVEKAALVFACLLGFTSGADAKSCTELSQLKLDHVTIDRAESTPAGTLEVPVATGIPGRKQAFDVPAFCRVAATLKPTSASNIKIEV